MAVIINTAPIIHLGPEELGRVTWRINGATDIYLQHPSLHDRLSLRDKVVKKHGQVVELELVSVLGFSISGWGHCELPRQGLLVWDIPVPCEEGIAGSHIFPCLSKCSCSCSLTFVFHGFPHLLHGGMPLSSCRPV